MNIEIAALNRYLLIVALMLANGAAQAALNIFACEPEWAALAQRLGGAHVQTFSATSAHQDVHFIQARPSLIAKLRRADLLICTGAGLEAGWLPMLLRRANNHKVQPGSKGHLIISHGIELMDRPAHADRAEGDVHPEGNPHLHLDPRNLLTAARLIGERLRALDPANAREYQTLLEKFLSHWESVMEDWKRQVATLTSKRVVVHHMNWNYLMRWLGLELAGTLEPKPGVPPSSRHLSVVMSALQSRAADCIIRTNYQSSKPSRWLAERARIPMVELPYTVGAGEETTTLETLFAEIIRRLKANCI